MTVDVMKATSFELQARRDEALSALARYNGALKAYLTRPDLGKYERRDCEAYLRATKAALDTFIKA